MQDSEKTYGVNKYWTEKYQRETKKNWDLFFKRNKCNFYKDRHWLTNDRDSDGFFELRQENTVNSDTIIVIEAGCGVGNSVFPLLTENPKIFCHAFDISDIAIDLFKKRPEYDSSRCNAFVWNFAETELNEKDIPSNSADFALLCFCLSAVTPSKHMCALESLRRCIRKDGVVFFRDYADGDLAQQRFSSNNQIGERYFVRQDGTFSYFFLRDELIELFRSAGFELIEMKFVEREVVNRKREITMSRKWVQARFRAS